MRAVFLFTLKIGHCTVFQIHPMGLCNDGDFTGELSTSMDLGWVFVVKLELPHLDPDPCMSVYDKVKFQFVQLFQYPFKVDHSVDINQ